jgi:uncharacterized repeat protein (TIGR03943 family)
MTALFIRWLPALTLGIWSAVLLHLSEPYGPLMRWIASWSPLFSGRVDTILAIPFRVPMLLAGIVLLLLSIVFLLFPADTACCQAAECGHPLSRFTAGRWLTFLVLVLPVTVSARYSPAGFSRTTMENRGIATDISGTGALASKVKEKTDALTAKAAKEMPSPAASDPLALPLPQSDPNAPAAAPAPATAAAAPSLDSYVQRTPEGYLEAEVLDLLYAAQDNTLRKVFEDKTVQLIGQLMPEPAEPAGTHRFKAVRMFMTCCAADARPVATAVEISELPKLPEMTWIKIVGKATFPVENGRRSAVLKAETVEKTEPPPESMLY